MFRSILICVVVCILCMLSILHMTSAQISEDNSSDANKVNLYHYSNPLNPRERHNISDPSLFKYAKLEVGKRMKIVIHGAGGHCFNDDVPFRVVKAYLRTKVAGREDYNVLCLDYGPLAQLGSVPGEAIPTVKSRFEYVCNLVAEKTANLILALRSEGYVSDLSDIHVIGHSLGGQLSGFLGRKIQEKTDYENKLGRITGLDIMNIFLVYSGEVNLRNQLDLSDAHFVDIVHTSPIGLQGDIGHVDYYPDGGLHQRSCFARGPISNVTELIIGSCSHIIVGQYWEHSIDNPNITACKDDSWEKFSKRRSQECAEEDTIIFGEYVPTRARGKYFLKYPMIKVSVPAFPPPGSFSSSGSSSPRGPFLPGPFTLDQFIPRPFLP